MPGESAIHSIYREGLFDGKVVVISGGGTGIGRATARELAALGATVILCSRAPGHLEATRDEILAAGGKAAMHRVNIRDPESVEALFSDVVAGHGRVDGLVNNGGGQFPSPTESITPKGWHAVVETNLYGTFYMTQAAFNHGMRERGGAVVNIVIEMWRGFPGFAHSAAARAGVVNLTQTLAVEWARYGIRVNAIAPGVIDSSGLKNYDESIRSMLGQIAKEIPAGRMGTESEIAAAIIFLLSPASSFTSGATLRVDGAGSLYHPQGFVIPEHESWPGFTAFSSPPEPGE